MNSLQERFRLLASARPDISQADLARATGAKSPSVNAWFSGVTKSLKAETAAKLAHIYKCNPIWLATGVGDPWMGGEAAGNPSLSPLTNDVVIPEYNLTELARNEFNLNEQPPGTIKAWRVDKDWLRMNVRNHTGDQNLCLLTGYGSDMKPKYNPGDPLLCDRGVSSVDAGGVFFFRVANQGFIKHLQRIPTDQGMVLRAKSYNPDYDPFDITDRMDFQVLAKVLICWKSEHL